MGQTCMGTENRVPLFINRYSLSPRTAIGVQTLRLLGPHQDWLHFHWWTNSFQRQDPRSVLFENTVLSRYSFLHRPKPWKIIEKLGLSSWSGSDLRPSLAKRLADHYRGRVSSAYVAPLGEDDATRCLELTNLVGVPFVLHLWDVLDGDVATGALRELVNRAERVFCVSQPLMDDVLRIRGDAELLSFSRDAAQATAKPREQGPIKVVMHGNVCSYAEGLDDLDQAIDSAREQRARGRGFLSGRLPESCAWPRPRSRSESRCVASCLRSKIWIGNSAMLI